MKSLFASDIEFHWFRAPGQGVNEIPCGCKAAIKGEGETYHAGIADDGGNRTENKARAVQRLADYLLSQGFILLPASAHLSTPEPPPVPEGDPVWDMVIEDMRERDRFGEAKYGQRLLSKDGRNTLVDAYQEALDLVVYMRKAIEDAKRPAAGGLDAYQALATEMACDSIKHDFVYFVTGLGGEAGEVFELFKKHRRDNPGIDIVKALREKMRKELGDVLWYVSQLARVFELSLADVAATNIAKLQSRKDRGVLGGSGDDR